VGRKGSGERVVHEAGDLLGAFSGCGELGQRPDERHVVDLLQRSLAPAQRWRATAEDDDRRVVRLRGCHRAHAVGHARPGGEGAHTGLASDLRPTLGCERCGGLVANVDDVDALLATAVVDREQVPAG